MPAQITLDVTPAGEASNSYNTVPQAGAYLDGHMDEQVWTDNSEYQEAALVAAARQMNLMIYKGRRYSEAQALAFPRHTDVVGVTPYIRSEVRYAQIEQAIFILKQFAQGGASTAREQLIAAGVVSARIGDVEEKYGDSGKAQANVSLCERTRGGLRPFLAGTIAWGY